MWLVEEKCNGDFDVAWVGDADDDGAGDGWMCDELFFDFEGIDVFTS